MVNWAAMNQLIAATYLFPVDVFTIKIGENCPCSTVIQRAKAMPLFIGQSKFTLDRFYRCDYPYLASRSQVTLNMAYLAA